LFLLTEQLNDDDDDEMNQSTCQPFLSLKLFFPIRLEPDFAGFGITNLAGARARFSNRL